MRTSLQTLGVAVVLSWYLPAAFSDGVVIESIQGNGTMTWSNGAFNGIDRVEWASSPTGSWKQSWQSLVNLPVTGGTTTVEIPMFFRVVYTPETMVTDEQIGTSDGFSTYYLGHLAESGILSNTLFITAAGFAFDDANGDGLLEGSPAGSGILMAGTGAWLLHFSAGVPSGGEPFVADYSYVTPAAGVVRDEVIGVGNGSSTIYTDSLAHSNVVDGTLSVSIGTFFMHDLDGDGNLVSVQGGGSGTIDYPTGAWSLNLAGSSADLNGTFKASYQYID
jgi:hypothetical protein